MRRLLVLLLIGVLVFSVAGSGCIGGGKEKAPTTTSTPMNKTVNYSAVLLNVENQSGRPLIKATGDLRLDVEITSPQKPTEVDAVINAKFGSLKLHTLQVEQKASGVYQYTFGATIRGHVAGSGNITFTLHLPDGSTKVIMKKVFVSLEGLDTIEVSANWTEKTIEVNAMTPSDLRVMVFFQKFYDFKTYFRTAGAEVISPVPNAIKVVGFYSNQWFPFDVNWRAYANIKLNKTAILSYGRDFTAYIKFKLQFRSSVNASDVVTKTVLVKLHIHPETATLDVDSLKKPTILNSWMIPDKNVVVYRLIMPNGGAKELNAIYSFTLNNESLPLRVVFTRDSIRNITKYLPGNYSTNVKATVNPDNNVAFVIVRTTVTNITKFNSMNPTLKYVVTRVTLQNGEVESTDIEASTTALVNGLLYLNVSSGGQFNLDKAKVQLVDSYQFKNGLSGGKYVGVYYFMVSYPYLLEGNKTVILKVDSSKTGNVSVILRPLGASGVYSLATGSNNIPDNTYLIFDENVTLYNVYVYTVSNSFITSDDLTITLSTKGYNGESKEFDFNVYPKFSTTFKYYGFVKPVVEGVERDKGFIVTPYDVNYISWVKTMGYLYDTGVPVSKPSDSKVSVPVIFVTPKTDSYHATIMTVDGSGQASMTKIAEINSTSVYYADVAVKSSSIPYGLSPLYIFIKDSSGKVVYGEFTYIDGGKLAELREYSPEFISSLVLDNFVESGVNSYVEKMMLKQLNITKTGFKNDVLEDGTLVVYGLDGKPLYGMSYGYLSFKRKDVNFNYQTPLDYTAGVKLDYSMVSKSATDYWEFMRGMANWTYDPDRVFAVEILANPVNIPNVKPDKGDDKRLISVGFIVPGKKMNADQLKTIDPSKFVKILPAVSPGKFYFVNPTPVEITVEFGDKTITLEPFSESNAVSISASKSVSVTFEENGNVIKKVAMVYSPTDLQSGVFAGGIIIPTGEFKVDGKLFLDPNQRLPFVNFKILVPAYLDVGVVKEANLTFWLSNDKFFSIAVPVSNVYSVAKDFLTPSGERKPAVVRKFFSDYVVYDIFIPYDSISQYLNASSGKGYLTGVTFYLEKSTPSGVISARVADFGANVHSEFPDAVKLMATINFYDAVVDDFSFYDFYYVDAGTLNING